MPIVTILAICITFYDVVFQYVACDYVLSFGEA